MKHKKKIHIKRDLILGLALYLKRHPATEHLHAELYKVKNAKGYYRIAELSLNVELDEMVEFMKEVQK